MLVVRGKGVCVLGGSRVAEPVCAEQVPGEEPRKGKKTGNFGVQTKALESAAERHAVSQHDQVSLR